MNYSLGNMVGGGGALNPDGLALDLAFAADKTLTARKGPTPTFTRGSTATFVGSNGLIQSAAINAPRFDHYPVTLVSRGLLIEEQRTNLLVQSENFGTTWSAVNLVTTGTPPYLNVGVSPAGTTTAEKLIATSTSGTHQFRQEVSLAGSTTYVASVFYKAIETNFATISIFGPANGNVGWDAYFNISPSYFSAGNFNGFSSISISDAGSGWCRCQVVFTTTATGNLSIRFGGSSAATLGSNFYSGNNSSGFLVWGAQLEIGSFPTSYIPTTTAALTRSADVCSITGTDFTSFYNPVEGSVAVLASSPASENRAIVGIDDNTANEMIRLRTEGADPFYRVVDGGSEVVALDLGSISANTSFKIAAAYADNDFAASLNGGAASTDTVGTLPTVDRIRIGADQGGNTFTGTIGRISYYRKRLANSKLQTLST